MKKLPRNLPGVYAARYVTEQINKEVKLAGYKDVKFNKPELDAIFTKYNGDCVFCGKPLHISTKKQANTAIAMFYVPLKDGGEPEMDNVVIACYPCYETYRPVRKPHDTILGADSFADFVELLIRAVKEDKTHDEINFIKRRINAHLEEVILLQRHTTVYSDWTPDKYTTMMDGESSIPDIVEDMTKQPDKENKERLKDAVKQTVKTKQYKIIRNPNED